MTFHIVRFAAYKTPDIFGIKERKWYNMTNEQQLILTVARLFNEISHIFNYMK